MEQHNEVFVGLDVAKARHAVAVAEDGRQGEVRYLGEIEADAASIRKLVARLEKPHGKLHFCYEPAWGGKAKRLPPTQTTKLIPSPATAIHGPNPPSMLDSLNSIRAPP